MHLLREGLAKGTRAKDIHAITGWSNAMSTALRMIQPGELLLVQADVVDEAVGWLKNYLAETVAVSGNGAGVGVGAPLNGHHAVLHVSDEIR